MSRREMALNVVLGAGLLFAFAIVVSAAFLALRFALYLFDLALTFLYPPAPKHPNEFVLIALCIFILGNSLFDFRQRRWRAGFLALAGSSMLTVVCLLRTYENRPLETPWILFFFLVFSTPKLPYKGRDIQRNPFLLAGILLCLGTLSVLGVLGMLTSLVNVFLIVLTTGWFIMESQKSRPGVEDKPSTTASS